MYLCLADACICFYYNEYGSTIREIIDRINSVFVLLLSQLIWMQTDLIPSGEDKYYIGWYYLGVFTLLFAVNLVVVAYLGSITAAKHCKKCYIMCQRNMAEALKKK